MMLGFKIGVIDNAEGLRYMRSTDAPGIYDFLSSHAQNEICIPIRYVVYRYYEHAALRDLFLIPFWEG